TPHLVQIGSLLLAMVNIPGTSKRCKQCSVRRVKVRPSSPIPRNIHADVHFDIHNFLTCKSVTLDNRVAQDVLKVVLSVAAQQQDRSTIKELHDSAQSNKLIAPISIPSSLGCSMDLYRSAVADLWIVTCHPATIPID
ncbi:hypothetical protein N5P37_006293, partial [Trichoderma harzianum]